jgi:hypothetical protein
MKYIKLFENFTDGDNKYPFSITVKPRFFNNIAIDLESFLEFDKAGTFL